MTLTDEQRERYGEMMWEYDRKEFSEQPWNELYECDRERFRYRAEAVAVAARSDVLAEIEELFSSIIKIKGYRKDESIVDHYGIWVNKQLHDYPSLAELLDAHGKDTE